MGEVVRLQTITRLNLNPDAVLKEAIGKCPEGVFIAGYDADGDLFFASSIADGGTVLWMMEIAKARLLKMAGEPE